MREATTATFAEQLEAEGLLVPAGVHGIPARSARFEELIARFDALVMREAAGDEAEALLFPPVMARSALERAGYMESFPHLCGAVHSFAGKEGDAREIERRIAAGESWSTMMGMTDVVLAPSACYPLYPTLRGTLPEGGRHVTLRGWVFRNEPSAEPTRMQSFRMREFIRVGDADVVVAWRDAWLERGLRILRSLGLPAESSVASDPFFGRGGRMLAAGQREQRLKLEVLVPILPDAEPTACCSFNYHQDKFALAFDIRLANGERAHSACMGFGMERVALALLKTHGLDPERWPASVRELLWP